MKSDITNRLSHLKTFYALLELLEAKMGGRRVLAECSAGVRWPQRGVYFFFESGENRSDSGSGERVVRVGTHALKTGSKTTLWTRLSQHRGVQSTGGGNHRGSVFRLHVGTSLLDATPGLACSSWAIGSTASTEVRRAEHEIEMHVTRAIGAMTVICLPIGDPAGPESDRGYIERNSIALLSNSRKKQSLDLPSAGWLGSHCRSDKVRLSGLWNSNHVGEPYDAAFLDRFSCLIEGAES